MRTPKPLACTEVGAGPTVLVLHAYGMEPRTYLPLAREIADRARVIIPDLFDLAMWWDWWDFEHAVDCLEATLDDLAVDRVTPIGHSFGGGLELGLAARCPHRMVECVFADTLGPRHQLSLARETLRPVGIVRTATRPAAASFLRSWARHPVQLVSAAVGGYLAGRDREIEAVARAGSRCHVLWAEGDEILSRRDGVDFARKLDATFIAVERPPNHDPIDHDWVFDEPQLFARYLDKLGLRALSNRSSGNI
jgi:pimeloyl-ACP methyl ester carboxylesterase